MVHYKGKSKEIQMNLEVEQFLRGKTAVSTQTLTWQWHNHALKLRQKLFIGNDLPPDNLSSSVRAVLLRGEEVMVVRDHQNNPYIIPGGRREPGETISVTLQRELLEETGWAVRETAVIATYHFQHLAPQPPDYQYPYPHFFWPIFVAEADQFHPEAIEEDFYVTHASFQPIEELRTWALGDGQQELLKVACKY